MAEKETNESKLSENARLDKAFKENAELRRKIAELEERASVEPVAEKKPEIVYVSAKPDTRPDLQKVGRDPELGSKKGVVFRSMIKNLMFDRPYGFIQFAGYEYKTDNKEDLAFLRNHKALGVDFVEGDYTQEMKDKIKADRQYVVRSEEMLLDAE